MLSVGESWVVLDGRTSLEVELAAFVRLNVQASLLRLVLWLIVGHDRISGLERRDFP